MFVCKSENILLGREVRTILMTKHLPSSFISVTSWIYLGRVHCCCQDPNLNKQPNGISLRVSLLISCLQLYIEYTTKTKIEDSLNLILINKYYFLNLILMRLIFCSPTLFAPKVRRWTDKFKKKNTIKKKKKLIEFVDQRTVIWQGTLLLKFFFSIFGTRRSKKSRSNVLLTIH